MKKEITNDKTLEKKKYDVKIMGLCPKPRGLYQYDSKKGNKKIEAEIID